MNVASSPLPAPQSQLTSLPEYQPLAAPPAETSTDILSRTITATNTPAPGPTGITTTTNGGITAPTSQSIITVSTTVQPTIATTTISFSDHVITVAPTHKPSTTSSTKRVRPSETPYGTTSSSNTNGGIMLTVSLAVVFGVLTSMGLVICCLFRRRRKRRMNMFGKGSNSNSSSKDELDDMMAAAVAGHHRSSTLVPGGSGAQEMSEQYQGAHPSNRGSTLSLGPGLHRQSNIPPNQMLAPASSATRPASMGSGYWSGSTGGHRESVANSMMDGSTGYVTGAPQFSNEFRNSHHEQYYGAPSIGHSPLLNPIVNGGIVAATSSNYNSREQLLLHQHQCPNGYSSNVSSRSNLSPGLHPQQDALQNSSPNFRANTTSLGSHHYPLQPPFYGHPPTAPGAIMPQGGVRPISDSYGTLNAGGSSNSLNADGATMRPQSMMPLNTPATLVIPPSITSRPRSSMNNYNVNANQPLPSRLQSSPITAPVSSQASTPAVNPGSDQFTAGNTTNVAPEMISGPQPSSNTPAVLIAPAPSMTVAAESCTSQGNDMSK
ncbi:hypothetical protein BG011_005286 [Mortierella polycephala]|uniref:Uncharacterized protein n=1 Tax=Mortierella polycephala TaxID=41804 RepID=A0A9P6PXU5_9FUNG|nr:hypothetical protein BG011_005286 [Mortierella polycephala]